MDTWKGKMKYLNVSTDKNKEALKKHTELLDKIKYLMKTMHGGEAGPYEKEFMKMRFNLDNNTPLNKILKFYILKVIVRSVFQEDGKYYLQVFLDEFLYKL